MSIAADGSIAVGGGFSISDVPVLDPSEIGNIANVATPPEFLAVDVTAGQNINQTAGVLTTSATMTLVGSDPLVVHVCVNLHGVLGDATSGARVAPVVELWRVTGTAEHLVTMATGYIRDSQDHEENSFNSAFYDLTPGASPEYELRTRRDSTVSATLPVGAPSTVTMRADF